MSGRIPQSFIDDLLARTDIVDIIEARVTLKKAGKNYSGLCPFHQEKSPSFSVSPDKQFYYCFGCGAGGNAISFITEYENLPFPQAVEDLAKRAGIEIPKDNSQQRHNEHLYQAQFKILDLAAVFYQSQLKNNAARQTAIDYLKGRGLDGKIAKQFGIGFAPPGWDNLIKSIGLTDTDQAHLELSGMLIRHEQKDSLYDRFRDRIMFPIRDMRGRVIAFGGRILGDGKPKYLNSPETDTFHKGRELYGLYEARKADRKLNKILIVEGYMDVISLAQFDINYSVATLGTATSLHHLERLYKIVPEIIFCFDGDKAGLKAAQRALETTMPVIKDGQQAKFLFLPEGEDPDTLVRLKGKQHFEELIQSATPMSEYFFNSLSSDIDMQSIDGRAVFSSQALPLIQQMQPSLLQQMMRERICEITGLSIEQLASSNHLHDNYDHSYYQEPPTTSDGQFQQTNKQQQRQPRAQQNRRPNVSNNRKRSANISLINRIISLLLHNPSLISQVEVIPDLALIEENNADILALLVDYWLKYPSASIGQMLIDWQDDSQYASKLLVISEISRLNPCPDNNYQQMFIDSWEKLKQRRSDLAYQAIKNQQSSLKSNLSAEVKMQAKQYLEEIAAQHKKNSSQ
ncbi:MAG: DNA primase [Pseudomonadales bacterium]|nr:DNA primase [Pseudomonadales bacterium]NRA18061.1 DNA primase [Oceanospirillaceae bacterium]